MPDDKLITIDFGSLLKDLKDLPENLETQVHLATEHLASEAHQYILDQAEQELHSTLPDFQKALHMEELEKGVWVITLDADMVWLDEGMESFSLIDTLLKDGKGKTSKDGHRYRVIPFKHDKAAPKQNPPEIKANPKVQKKLIGILQKTLAKKNLTIHGIEKHMDGTPKTGKLHSLDIKQGPKSKNTGIPLLQGVRIYQHAMSDKEGKPLYGDDGHRQVQRSVMTFRTVSTKQEGTGAWQHPGVTAHNFMDRAYQWAQNKWESEVLPELLKNLGLG